LHVPLVIWAPGTGAPGGIRVTEPVSLRALPATMAELAGITGHPFPGVPLTRAFGGGGTVGDTVLSELSWREEMPTTGRAPILKGNMRSVIRDSLHYLLNGDDSEELYDIVRDPAEKENLIGRVSDDTLEPLRSLLRAIPTPDRKGRLGF
jgi:arylsulfatase A-like enzyme